MTDDHQDTLEAQAEAVIDAMGIEEHVTEAHGGKTIRKSYSIGYSEEIAL